MNSWDYARIALECEALSGLDFRQVYDLDEVSDILKEMDKSYLSPLLDPDLNDFTDANCFWLIAEDAGRPLVAGGVRLDILNGTGVEKFWEKTLRRAFNQAPKRIESPFPEGVLGGRVAYFGDLISRSDSTLSRVGRDRLRYFTYVGHYLTQTCFKPDVTYCFIQDKDYVRGAPNTYGFLDKEPFLYDWDSDPYPQGRPEWVAYLSKAKFARLSMVMRRVTGEEARRIMQDTRFPQHPAGASKP